MYSNVNKIKNIEIPDNLFSNLGESKKNKKEVLIKKTTDEILKNYDEDIKLTNLSNKKAYRDRINKMYEDIRDLIPINNEIDNILYFNNYVERGIVIKPKVSSLKQFWTEYRLIENEKKGQKNYTDKKDKENDEQKSLNNFDNLFEALSQRVIEINDYIDELKEMKADIDNSNNKLANDKEKLKEEKQRFTDYKLEEEKKINKEKETLKKNYDRLQNIINDLDKKLNEIETK